MSAKYNFTTHLPPVPAAQHRPMAGERLPPCLGLVQAAGPLGGGNHYNYCLCTYCVPGTVPDTSHSPVLIVVLGRRALFAVRRQKVPEVCGNGEKWTRVQKGTRLGWLTKGGW